jgi:putative addiction module killer protein
MLKGADMLEIEQSIVFEKWFLKLTINIQSKLNDYIDRVSQGNTSNCKNIRNGISEIVINYQKGYRIYYTILKNNTILLLLAGGDKSGHGKSQQEDVEKAIAIKNYMKEQGDL